MTDAIEARPPDRTAGWCSTHDDFAWVYIDGSIGCFGACILEESSSQCEAAAPAEPAGLREALVVLERTASKVILRLGWNKIDSREKADRLLELEIAADHARAALTTPAEPAGLMRRSHLTESLHTTEGFECSCKPLVLTVAADGSITRIAGGPLEEPVDTGPTTAPTDG